MWTRIFALAAAAMMLAGCTETPQNMGAAVDRDQNVLTGGPITGTTLLDLPQAVKDALKNAPPTPKLPASKKPAAMDAPSTNSLFWNLNLKMTPRTFICGMMAGSCRYH